jgi:hypothetical protein
VKIRTVSVAKEHTRLFVEFTALINFGTKHLKEKERSKIFVIMK